MIKIIQLLDYTSTAITVKFHYGKLPYTDRKLLEYKQSTSEIIEACREEEFEELAVSGTSLELIKTLPDIHRDPSSGSI